MLQFTFGVVVSQQLSLISHTKKRETDWISLQGCYKKWYICVRMRLMSISLEVMTCISNANNSVHAIKGLCVHWEGKRWKKTVYTTVRCRLATAITVNSNLHECLIVWRAFFGTSRLFLKHTTELTDRTSRF